jgi:DNA-nicking Smr family endonuclease
LLKPDNLDGQWDRRIDKGAIVPDVSVDLHGSGLSGAYARLDGALEQAIAQRMKVVLLVTGKVRTHDRASGEGRGAIASVVRDWLAASRHAGSIAAVRNAHPRHGGAGALYIVLKR